MQGLDIEKGGKVLYRLEIAARRLHLGMKQLLLGFYQYLSWDYLK